MIHHQESIDETINDIEQQNEIIDQINSELMAFEDGDYDTEYALQESESVLRDLSSQLAAQDRDFKQEVNNKEEFLKNFEEVIKPEIISNLQDVYLVFKNIELDVKKIVNKIDDLIDVIFYNKKDFGFYQPDQYLEKSFGISDFILKRKILNIGLIKNDNSEYGIELIENLANKNIISIETQKEILLKFQQNKSIKESLLPVLKEQGYIGIRYYESESMYLSSKQSFKFEDFGIIEKDLKSKKKQTPKI